MPRIMLECVHADTCLPGFWSGHYLPYVQIPVYNGMTLKEIKASISDELKQGAVMGNCENAYLLWSDYVNPDNEKKADQVTKAAYAAVNRIKPNKKGQRKFFTDLEKQDDPAWDTVYAYFVFVEI